jgi:hypothetical protein
MAVYPDGTKCFVAGCGAHETADEFLTRIHHTGEGLPALDPDYTRAKKERRANYKPEPSLLAKIEAWHRTLVDPQSPRHDRIVWLLNRNLSRQTIERYKLGHTGTKLTIPVWQGDTIVGVRFRLDPNFADGGQLKVYKYTTPTGQPALLFRPNPRGRSLVIVEGELDALLLGQFGYDAVTTTSGADTLGSMCGPDTLKGKEPLVAVDNDKAGDAAYLDLCRTWGRELRRWTSEHKDITDATIAYGKIDLSNFLHNELSR